MDTVERFSGTPHGAERDSLADEEIDVVGTPNTTSSFNNSLSNTGTVILIPLQNRSATNTRAGQVLNGTNIDHSGPSIASSSGPNIRANFVTGTTSYTGQGTYRGYGVSSHLGGQDYTQRWMDWNSYNAAGMSLSSYTPLNYLPNGYPNSGSSIPPQMPMSIGHHPTHNSSTTSQAYFPPYSHVPPTTPRPSARPIPSDQINAKEECLGMELFDFFNSSIQQLDLLVAGSLWRTATSCLIPLEELSTNVRKVQQQFNIDLVRHGHKNHSHSYCASKSPPFYHRSNSLILSESKKDKNKQKRQRENEIMLD